MGMMGLYIGRACGGAKEALLLIQLCMDNIVYGIGSEPYRETFIIESSENESGNTGKLA